MQISARCVLSAILLCCVNTGYISPVSAQEERMVFIGGANQPLEEIRSIDVYEFSTSTWTLAADITKPTYDVGACTTDELIYAIGGFNHFPDGRGAMTNSTQIYSLTSNEWSFAPSMTTARGGHGAVPLAGKIYIIGGSNGTEHLSSGEVFDPATQRWSQMRDMSSKRYLPGAAVLGDRLFAVGGLDGGVRQTSVESYDVIGNTWTAMAPMTTSRYGLAVVVVDEKLYAIGGGGYPEYLRSAEVYDLKTNKWVNLPSMVQARSGCAGVALDGLIYVTGGFNMDVGVVGTIEIYDTKKTAWTNLPLRMPTARYLHAVVLVNSNITTVTTTASTSSYTTTTATSASSLAFPGVSILLFFSTVFSLIVQARTI